MTRTKKTSVLFLSIVMAVSFCVGGIGFLGAKRNAIADGSKYYATSSNGVLKFNADEFEVVEDYSAFVPAAIPASNGIHLLSPNGEQLMRLDQGKKGLLVKSVQSGDDVEGDSFSFANPLSGDFEMDFRVFSERTVQVEGENGLNFKGVYDNTGTLIANTASRGLLENNDILPALDVRRVGITIRSITDPTKAFTVYAIAGRHDYSNHQVSLSVGIEGEKWYSWYMGEKYPGYGLEGTNASDFGYNTVISGTTMSNANANDMDTFSTTIKFDVDTMCVYGVRKTTSIQNYGNFAGGVKYTESDVLVRNLASNAPSADGTGTLDGKRLEELATLSKEDFINGYTTSVTILDMTSNDTVVTKAISNSAGGDVYSNAITEKVADPYDRYAKMIIYSVNGQEFVKNDDWTVEYNSNNAIADFDTAKGLTRIQGYNGSVVNASYDTSVKNGTEQGSTKIAFTGARLDFLTKNQYVRHHGDMSRFVLPVYITGTENDYIVQVWTTSGTKLYGNVITPNTWTNVTFASNAVGASANWDFDLNDVYVSVTKANTNITEQGASIHLGRMYYYHVDSSGATTNHQLNTQQLRLTSSATNIAAEGNAYGLTAADYKMSDGTYVIGLTAESENYATANNTEKWDFGDYYTKQGPNWTKYGTGAGTYQKDPYSDVRELGLTIRSTIDPTKSFTIYLASSSHYRSRTTARVYVEGEAFRNGSGKKGIAFSKDTGTNLSTAMQGLQKGEVGGTMGQWGNTYANDGNGSTGSYNEMNQTASFFKFEPSTMTVYAYAYGWTKIRDLTTTKQFANTSTNGAGEVMGQTYEMNALSTLDASYFADGNFTMEVFVSEMNTEWNKGLSNVYFLDGTTPTAVALGHDALSEGYDRKCIIDIYKGRLNEGINIDEESVYSVQQPGYEVTYDWLDISALKASVVDGAITLSAPQFINLFETVDYSGSVAYVSRDRTDSGFVTFENGVATFNPKTSGTYTFTLNGKATTVEVYAVTVNGKVIYGLEKTIKLSDLEVEEVSGSQFVGYTIDGLDGIYSDKYEIDLTVNNVVTAKYVDLAMTEGASIRFSATTPGIRFRSTISKDVADEMLALSGGKVSFTYSITANGITKEQAVDIQNGIVYNQETGNYEMYAAVIGLVDSQYETKFDASVITTLTTADGETITLNALKVEDSARSIKEVALLALENADELTNGQIKLLKEFAGITATEE